MITLPFFPLIPLMGNRSNTSSENIFLQIFSTTQHMLRMRFKNKLKFKKLNWKANQYWQIFQVVIIFAPAQLVFTSVHSRPKAALHRLALLTQLCSDWHSTSRNNYYKQISGCKARHLQGSALTWLTCYWDSPWMDSLCSMYCQRYCMDGHSSDQFQLNYRSLLACTL